MRKLHSNEQQLNLNEFLNRNWLNRSWTLQEIVLAKDPIIVCGTKTIPWRTFICGIIFLDGLQVFQPSIMTKWLAIIALWADCSNHGERDAVTDLTTQYVQDFHNEWTEAQFFALVCHWIKLVFISVAIIVFVLWVSSIIALSKFSFGESLILCTGMIILFFIFKAFCRTFRRSYFNFFFIKELARSR
jgi:hypothetical protein